MAGIFRKIAPWPMGMAIALSAAFALPEIVASQTASEVTPDSFQPPQQRLSGAVVFTGQAGTQAPPGSENLSIQIADVTIEAPLPQLDTANAAYRERLTRGRIAVSEIFEATADLEAAYAQAGFVLTRVVLPEQSLSDGGALRVVVVNGFVEAVDDSRVSDQVRGRVGGLTQNLLWPLERPWPPVKGRAGQSSRVTRNSGPSPDLSVLTIWCPTIWESPS